MGFGDHVEVKGLVEARGAGINPAGRTDRKATLQSIVFGLGEFVDDSQGVREGLGKGGQRLELLGPGGAERFEVEPVVGGQKGGGLGAEAVLMLFEEAGEDVAMQGGDPGRVGEVGKPGKHKQLRIMSYEL